MHRWDGSSRGALLAAPGSGAALPRAGTDPFPVLGARFAGMFPPRCGRTQGQERLFRSVLVLWADTRERRLQQSTVDNKNQQRSGTARLPKRPGSRTQMVFHRSQAAFTPCCCVCHGCDSSVSAPWRLSADGDRQWGRGSFILFPVRLLRSAGAVRGWASCLSPALVI